MTKLFKVFSERIDKDLPVVDTVTLKKFLQFTENEIDGEALLSLTERSLELLISIIGHRMKFLNSLTKLKDIADAHQRHEEGKCDEQQEHKKR